MAMIKIGQQKQEKQNTFNENSKNKVSDSEKITDVNWLKYKLRFWRCNKSFLQTVFCTEFCKLCALFWYQFKLQQKLSYPPNFKTNKFFQIWQLRFRLINLKLVWLETIFQREFNEKNRIRFNAHALSESFFKVGQLEEKSVPKQCEFASSNWRHIFFSYLR